MPGGSQAMKNGNDGKQKERQSGIELIKVFAIFLIILSHITQTLNEKNTYVSFSNYIVDLSSATTNIQILILQFMRGFGSWGNAIFFISSAWFLLDSKKVNTRKWLYMLLEVWVISVIIAGLFMVLHNGRVPMTLIIRSIMPNIFSNNGYITLYLLFYPIHVYLNKLINLLEKRAHFRIATSMFILYYVINYLHGGKFSASGLIYWVNIYLIVAYIKKYLPSFVANKKKNIIILIASIVLFYSLIFLTNVIGLRVNTFNDKPLHWASSNNPFLLIASICLVCLALNCKLMSRTINYISSLSLLIYIIHENIFLRTYTRPLILEYIHNHYNYSKIVLWVLLLAIIILFVSILSSIIYKLVLEKGIKRLAEKIHNQFTGWYGKLENKIINSKTI